MGVGFSDSLSPTYTWPGRCSVCSVACRTIQVVPVPENLAVDWQVTGDNFCDDRVRDYQTPAQ